MPLRFLLLLILIALLGGCESRVKYPTHTTVYYYPSHSIRAKLTHKHSKRVNKNKRSSKNTAKLTFIKNCKSGILHYTNREDVEGRLCLSYFYLRCNRIRDAEKLLKQLELKQLSGKNYGKVYALYGILAIKKGLNGKNYFELSYAYDPKNRVSRYMLSVKNPSINTAMRLAKNWCSKTQ